MRQSEKIKYMLTTELTEDELKNVIHYSFSNIPIDTKLWSELLDKLDLTDEDITTISMIKLKILYMTLSLLNVLIMMRFHIISRY